MSKSGVSNVRPAGWIRPTNWVFSRPRDDFAKYKNELQLFSIKENAVLNVST